MSKPAEHNGTVWALAEALRKKAVYGEVEVYSDPPPWRSLGQIAYDAGLQAAYNSCDYLPWAHTTPAIRAAWSAAATAVRRAVRG